MKIVRFVPSFITLTILMASSAGATTIDRVIDQSAPEVTEDFTIRDDIFGGQAGTLSGSQPSVSAGSVCNSLSFSVDRLAYPHQLTCEYIGSAHSKQALLHEYQTSPTIGNSITFRGWPVWISDGNAPPPSHYDTDSADNRHVRLEFRFGFYVNQNGRLQLQLTN